MTKKYFKSLLFFLILVFIFGTSGVAFADGFRFPIGDGWGVPTTTLTFGGSWSTHYGHLGEDYGYGYGTRVNAAYNGTVEYSYFGGADAYNQGWGNSVIIKHDVNGTTIYTQYDHLSAVSVSKGATVSTGQEIGKVGDSGFGTGAHLHFEIKSKADLGYGYAGQGFTTDTRVVNGLALTNITNYKPSWYINNHRTIDNDATPPTGSWILPTAGSFDVYFTPGTTKLKITAADNQGLGSIFFKAFYDGIWQDIGQGWLVSGTSEFERDWAHSLSTSQEITLRAVITDKAGNVTNIDKVFTITEEQHTVAGDIVGGFCRYLLKKGVNMRFV